MSTLRISDVTCFEDAILLSDRDLCELAYQSQIFTWKAKDIHNVYFLKPSANLVELKVTADMMTLLEGIRARFPLKTQEFAALLRETEQKDLLCAIVAYFASLHTSFTRGCTSSVAVAGAATTKTSQRTSNDWVEQSTSSSAAPVSRADCLLPHVPVATRRFVEGVSTRPSSLCALATYVLISSSPNVSRTLGQMMTTAGLQVLVLFRHENMSDILQPLLMAIGSEKRPSVYVVSDLQTSSHPLWLPVFALARHLEWNVVSLLWVAHAFKRPTIELNMDVYQLQSPLFSAIQDSHSSLEVMNFARSLFEGVARGGLETPSWLHSVHGMSSSSMHEFDYVLTAKEANPMGDGLVVSARGWLHGFLQCNGRVLVSVMERNQESGHKHFAIALGSWVVVAPPKSVWGTELEAFARQGKVEGIDCSGTTCVIRCAPYYSWKLNSLYLSRAHGETQLFNAEKGMFGCVTRL